MSHTRTSGRQAVSLLSASRAVPTAVTVAPAWDMITESASRASTSSSTTSTRIPSRRHWGSARGASSAGTASADAGSGSSGRVASGRLTTKVAPRPSPALSASTLPPCISTS